MKAITLSLLLVCSIWNVSANSKIVCDDDDTLIPNPEDCSSFYVCDNGVPKLTPCPPTLHFNPDALVCDRPENVNCQVETTSTQGPTTQGSTEGSTTESQSTEGSTTEGSTTESQSTEGSSTEDSTTEWSTTEDPTTPPPTNQCPSTGSQLLPNPNDCSTFIVCINGHNTTVSCPNGMLYNDEIKTCDAPQNVNCNGNGGSTTEGPSSWPTSSTEGSSSWPTSSTGGSSSWPTSSTGGSSSWPTSSTESSSSWPTSSTGGSSSWPTSSTGGSSSWPTSSTEGSSSWPTSSTGGSSSWPTSSTEGSSSWPTSSTGGSSSWPTSSTEGSSSWPTSSTEGSSSWPTSSTGGSSSWPTSSTEGSSTWSTTEEATTPSPSGCPSNGSDIIPNPSDCGSYIVCIEGHHVTVPCPNGMWYNNNIKTCDKPQNVQCNIETSSVEPETSTQTETSTASDETTTSVSTTDGTTEGTEDPTSNSTGNGTTTTEITSSTTEKPGYTPNCPEEGYAVFENPESCSSFYVCVNGNSGLVECPAGHDFNPATVKCDLPANPQCRTGTTGPPPTVPPYVPSCPENETVLLPDPSSCGGFYICINGNYAQLSCPDDFEFNANSQSCVRPENSTCGIIQTYRAEYECEQDGSFPDPEDCSKYYVCVGNQVFPMECPGGLYFDVSLSTCNTPEQAQCSIETTEEPSTSTVKSTSTTTESASSTSTTTPSTTTEEVQTTTQEPTTTTKKPTTSQPGNEPDCPDEGSAILPNPDDCTQFFICIEGSFDVIDCPEGYAFNDELDRCDLAENVECDAGTTPSPNHPDCPSEGSAKLPNPEDCGSYIYCLNGQFAIIECPDGLNYDSNKKECSASATCSIGSTTTEESPSTVTKSTTTTERSTSTDTTEETSTTDDSSTESPGECTAEGELLPNPNDCESFYLCANGVPVEIQCPPGLEFNADSLVCDNPSTANCSRKVRSQSLFKFLQFWN